MNAAAGRCAWRVALLACVLLLGSAALPTLAQTRAADTRADLDQVKARLRALEAEAADTEKSRAEAARALAQAEKAVSQIKRRVRELRRERGKVEQELTEISAQQAATRAQIDDGRAALGHWLRRYYQHGGEPGVGHLLSAREPNQLARDAYYLERIGREKQAIVTRLRAAEARHAAQAEAIELRKKQVLALETRQTRELASLKKEQARRATILAELGSQLAAQRKEASSLKNDETRLIGLIRQLEAAPRRPAPNADPVVGEARTGAGTENRGKSFGDLRGRLQVPVSGKMIGRFGADRASGGTTWKGVFIRSPSGEEVRAVADGEVVYSDWLRGFGNLIIIDHGGDYLTVYGNNEALFKSMGERVASGDVIAAVGDSGGNPESGLYFEIRHQGRPQDPLDWVRLN